MTGLLFPFWTAVSYTVREETLDDWAFSIQRKMSLKVIFSPLPGRGCLQVRWVSWNESQRREWTVSLGSSFFYLLCLLQFASLTEVRSFKIFPKSKRRQRKSISHLFPSCQPKAGQTLTPVKLWGVISLLLCYFLLILVKSLLSFVERRNYLKCCVRWQKTQITFLEREEVCGSMRGTDSLPQICCILQIWDFTAASNERLGYAAWTVAALETSPPYSHLILHRLFLSWGPYSS